MKKHLYEIQVNWTGNTGEGTRNYKSYSRDHSINGEGKYREILASSDPAFLGDPTRYNPEDLFLSSLSSCHMLWYLHLCTVHKIVVTAYTDHATGIMVENADGSGKFTEVVLHPLVKITDPTSRELATSLHSQANAMCFIANSCNFEIDHHPKTEVE